MYEPQIDDYVKWTTSLGMVHEGWVYFKCDYTPKKKGFPHSEHYITIELGVKDMPTEQTENIFTQKESRSFIMLSLSMASVRIYHKS